MSTGDLIYLLLLVLSIPFGHVIKISASRLARQLLCGGAGLLIGVLLVGVYGLGHSFVVICGTYLIVRYTRNNICHMVTLVFVFAYLFFFRVCGRLGFTEPHPYANGLQLLVTLRMIGLAYEVNAMSTKKDDDADNNLHVVQMDGIPSLMDFLLYGYCYIGLLTGPYYTYQTYLDMCHQNTEGMVTAMPALRKLRYFPVIVLPYIFLAHFFPLSYLESEAYLDHPYGVPYQLAVLLPTFTWFRWRFYIAWMLAEAMCVMAGLGAYPFESEARPGLGPTKPFPSEFQVGTSLEEHHGNTHDFSTIDNIDIWRVETSSTMRAAMKAWNKTVQWWMSFYVYRKLPIANTRLKMFALLFVSAFWHGVHPGYYLTFLSVPLVVIAETRMIRSITPYLSATQKYWFDWACWFCLYRSFEYLGVGFMLLRLSAILTVWRRLYFIGHAFIVLFIVLPFFIPTVRKREKPSSDSASSPNTATTASQR